MDSLQGDRILVAAFVSVLVGFVTAVLSIVRLVNDKESKTTDYRQGWTDSLRTCLADLISNINSLTGTIVKRSVTVDRINALRLNLPDDQPIGDKDKALHDHWIKTLADDDTHIRELRRSMYQSYALTRLHFKPNDPGFAPLENKFDVITESLHKIESLTGESKAPDRLVLKERVHADVAEITGYGRFILKNTWETVKRGERAYELTKRWSLIGGGVALTILFIFTFFAALSFWKHSDDQAVKNTQSRVIMQHATAQPTYSDTQPSSQPVHSQTVTVMMPNQCETPHTRTQLNQARKQTSIQCDQQ